MTEAIPVISGDHRLQNYFMLISQVYGFDWVTLRKLLIQASFLAQQSERVQQHWLKLWSLHLVMVQHVTFEKFPGPENFTTTGLPVCGYHNVAVAMQMRYAVLFFTFCTCCFCWSAVLKLYTPTNWTPQISDWLAKHHNMYSKKWNSFGKSDASPAPG